MKTLALAAALIALPFVGGCTSKPSSATTKVGDAPGKGTYCTVQFKRDILGAARELPVSPMTGSINGAEVSVGGQLVRMSHEWIVLEESGAILWIPRENVLLIRAQK